jgi:protein-S-isoprenylcysteine O-methyltransferase Ste14
MSVDEPFRWMLVVGFVLVMPVGLYHRIRSQASGERLDRRQEGWFVLATLRPIAIASLLGTLAFIIHPASMAWSQLRLPTVVRWCGVPLGITTAALLVCVFRSIGDNITDTVVTRKQHQLVTHGPYRYVRNPLYTATLLAAIANGLVTANWFITVTGLTVFVLLMVRSRTEERFLVERFGEDYREYRNRTGSVFPKLPWLSR